VVLKGHALPLSYNLCQYICFDKWSLSRSERLFTAGIEVDTNRGSDLGIEKTTPDETVVKVDGEQFCPVAMVEPDTNVTLHVRLYPSRTTASTKMFLRELKRRTSSFSNYFSHVEPETAESWLQAFARWHNAAN
jgi:putative transposase